MSDILTMSGITVFHPEILFRYRLLCRHAHENVRSICKKLDLSVEFHCPTFDEHEMKVKTFLLANAVVSELPGIQAAAADTAI